MNPQEQPPTPAAPPKKKRPRSRRLPEFLRPAEASAFIGAAGSDRDRLILLCGLYAGLRVSEIVKLRVEDVDLADGLIFVREGKGKKDRWVPCPPPLMDPLRAWVGARGVGWVFPSPKKAGAHLTTRAVQYLVARVKQLAGLVRRTTPHVLRHSYATTLLRSGADITEVQRLLGHSSPQVTTRYLHCDPSRLKGVVGKLSFGETKGEMSSGGPTPPAPPEAPHG